MPDIFSRIRISSINPPKLDSGLKLERDPGEIGRAFHGAGTETCPPHRQRYH